MGKIILVTGGTRSGKSAFAERLVEEMLGDKIYLATTLLSADADQEMIERVARHRQSRAKSNWQTVEEGIELGQAISELPSHAALLIDCLTMWLTNILLASNEIINQDTLAGKIDGILDVCRKREGLSVFVTNEVGWGVVPENRLARQFRDLAGALNQLVAGKADEVVLVACGLPQYLKK